MSDAPLIITVSFQWVHYVVACVFERMQDIVLSTESASNTPH